jgi:enamine deaminase RidA (YjgF/YER057c/UK114 family)
MSKVKRDAAGPVVFGNQIVEQCYQDDYACYCRISNLLPPDKTAGREEQTYAVFQSMQTVLRGCDMQFTDIVRTWFFIDHILGWYDKFNRVRTKFMTENNVFEKILPASTGVGAANTSGAALIASALAIKPKTGLFTIQTIPSPLQCPALDYESSFSRAVETACPTHRVLYVSGTASINAEGISLYEGDAARQIEFTMQVVDSLLRSRGMNWTDVSRGVAYFKRRKDTELFRRYCLDSRIPPLPLTFSISDICREELLFEIELDAVKAVK